MAVSHEMKISVPSLLAINCKLRTNFLPFCICNRRGENNNKVAHQSIHPHTISPEEFDYTMALTAGRGGARRFESGVNNTID